MEQATTPDKPATRRWWADMPIAWKGLLIVLIPTFFQAVTLGVSLHLHRQQDWAESVVQESREMRAATRELYRHALNLETGARVYALTRRPEYREPYDTAVPMIPELLGRLESHVGPDTPQQLALGEVRHRIDRLVVYSAEMAGWPAQPGVVLSAEEVEAVRAGREAADSLRRAVERLQRLEGERFEVELARLDHLQGLNRIALRVSSAMGILAPLLIAALLARGLVTRLGALERYARRILEGEEATPVPHSRDELGRLAGTLEEAAAALAVKDRELRTSEQRLRDIVQNAAAVIVLRDMEGRFVLANRAACDLHGKPESEIVGHKLEDLYEPGSVAVSLKHDAEVLAAGRAMQFEEVLDTGSVSRSFLVVRFPLCDSEGNAYAMCSIATDVTAMKDNERALLRTTMLAEQARAEAERAREDAVRASRAKSDFLSRMSHELRTPLNSILGFGQLLEMDQLTPDQSENTAQIMRAGRHLLELINEVLDITRVETGRITLSVEPVSLGELLNESSRLMSPLAGERGVRLVLPPAEQVDIHVQADRQRILQVLLNIISNAIKYNREGGVALIEVAGGAESTQVEIRVADSGMGIKPQDLNRLFTPFDRLGADRTGTEGTGLGLALSRRLMEAMGGVLEVESTQDVGTTVILRLPRVESPLAAVNPTGEHVPGSPGAGAAAKVRILYVEDNLSNLRLIEHILKTRPHLELLAAMQGRLGLELAKDHVPALILLDLNLPDMTGAEVLGELKRDMRTQRIPVVIVSADATSGQIERLLEAGARAYVTKPLDVQDFLGLLDELTAKRGN